LPANEQRPSGSLRRRDHAIAGQPALVFVFCLWQSAEDPSLSGETTLGVLDQHSQMTPNGEYLESGKPFDKFSGTCSREIFANWLLCVTVNYADKPRPHPVEPHPQETVRVIKPEAARALPPHDDRLMSQGDKLKFQ
jgi:hypothetical protein